MSESAWATVMPAPERRELHRLLDVVDVIHDPATASRRNPDAWSDVEVIVGGWGVPPLDAAFLARVPALRAVFFTAGSVKGFVTDALWERGVRVTSAALANAQPVAEFTCAQIVLSLKRVWPRVFAWRDQRIYEQDDALAPGACDATVGLLALSRTGRLVRERLRHYDVNVLAYDPTVSAAEAEALEVELVSLERVFAESHIVSCHLPLLPETSRLLRAEHFALMRRGATFINTARGGVLSEAGLARVLADRPDLWALLDVVDQEPPRAASPLARLPNVVLTPHLAGSQGHECRRLGRMMLDEIRRFDRGDVLQGEVVRGALSALA